MKNAIQTLSPKSSTVAHPIYDDYRQIAHYWMLQLLVPLGGHKSMISEHCCSEDDVLHELALSHLLQTKAFSAKDARQALQKLYAELDSQSIPNIPQNTQLAQNIKWLGAIIGLNETEQAILHFRVIASRHLVLRDCVISLGQGIDLLYAANILSLLLNIDEEKIELALKPGAALIRTGLILVPAKMDDLMDKVRILSGLSDNLLAKHDSPYSLFKDNFTPAKSPKLTAEDYPHLKEDIALLKHYLADALENKNEGVNILIYGTPGSGKTEFVKMLAQEMGNPLFEIATEDSSGDPIRRADRFRAFRLSQHILSSNESHPLVLFDEVEDVFNLEEENDESKGGNASGMKGWINKLGSM